MIIITVGIATPSPTFAPVLIPEVDEAAGEFGDTVGKSVWPSLFTPSDNELVIEPPEADAEAERVVELERWRVAVIAEDPKVFIATPASASLNLPTPVSQHLPMGGSQQ